MSDVDLGPVILQQFKAVASYIGREDMLLLSGDDSILERFEDDVRAAAPPGAVRHCPGGHRHPVLAMIFGVAFVVCPMTNEGQVWILDNRRMPDAQR